MKRLVISILVGSAVSVVPLTALSASVAVMYAMDAWDRGDGIWPSLYLMLLPSLVAVPIVTLAAVIVGLPVHRLLVRSGYACDLAYSLAGALIGLALPLLLVLIDGSVEGFALPMLGLVSGAATGHAWWKARSPTERR